MKKNIVTLFVCLFLSTVIGIQGFSQQQKEDKNLTIQYILRTIVSEYHVSPPKIDDEFSVNVYNQYLESVDYYKRFLLQEDIDKFNKYKLSIDNQFINGSLDFFETSYFIISFRTIEANKYFKEIIEEPFDFSITDYVQTNPDSLVWCKDREDLKRRWYNALKYEVLNKIYKDDEAQKKAFEKNDTVTLKSFVELEKISRESVKKRYTNWFDEVLLKQEKEDYFAYYVNAILSDYDPHTSFFPPKDKEDFDISFSGQLEGIGATLTQKEGYITVTDIVPGSPSWKQGELEINDKILKVAQGDEEPVDVVDMRLDKAVRLIRGPKGTTVNLTIQKIDGVQKVISIIRDVVIIEATYAKSMIITDEETNSKIGYIYLPSFYANFNDSKGRRCSQDMKIELEKLKKENIQGVIVDLRNNTGGSLSDCVDIVGLFIDKGPAVQVKSKDAARTYSDYDSGTVWDGPLVVIVNQSSASASEIFAAAIQDYKRGVIIGSTTFGKGSVQRFEDLDKMVNNSMANIKPLGSIKVTLQKFYRINGGSTQLLGVTPDIQLNMPYKYIDYGERELDHPLPWTEMPKAVYNIWKSDSCNYTNVINNSYKRIADNSYFNEMDSYAKRLKEVRSMTEYPLEYETYTKFMKASEEASKRYDKMGKDTLSMNAVIITATNSSYLNDSTVAEHNKKWHGQVITDQYIYEAMKVCEDVEKMSCYLKKE